MLFEKKKGSVVSMVADLQEPFRRLFRTIMSMYIKRIWIWYLAQVLVMY